MAYVAGGKIEAADFNTLVGNAATANSLNKVWSTGSGQFGYGQPLVPAVTAGSKVAATDWASLITTTANIAVHQGSNIANVAVPVSGGKVTYLADVLPNLQTINTNKLNASAQGATIANAVSRTTTWNQLLTFTHTVTFANADAARYFFNAGGQLKITTTHANSVSGINLLFNQLASNVGTIVMSAPSSDSIRVSGVTFNGITKIGGGGATPTIDANKGYYGLSTANANVFSQTASTGPSGYLGTFIRLIAKTNGTQGANGDNGNIITLYTLWDEVPNGMTVGTGSTTTLTVVPPSTANIANTWGTITVTGAVAGS